MKGRDDEKGSMMEAMRERAEEIPWPHDKVTLQMDFKRRGCW